MKIFFIGDIVGKAGRNIIAENLADIKNKHNIDFVIANAENAAGGNGLTKNMTNELFRNGIDAITLGDHIWDQRCFEGEINSIEKLCRPANLPPNNPGKEYIIVEKNGFKLGVFCLLGENFMKIKADCPFRTAKRVVEEMTNKCDAIFLDFHAETTSEKVSMGWLLDGKIQALIGTHTHIPTNDARILPAGLAYLTDAGMTGPWESCLGRAIEPIIQKFLDGRPRQFIMAQNDIKICAAIVEIDNETKRAVSIEPFIYPPFRSSTKKESS